MSEQRQRFLEDYQLNYYSISELAERFSISRETAHIHPGHQGKWIHRFEECGQQGFHEQFRPTTQGNYDGKLGRRRLKDREKVISPHHLSFGGLFTQSLA